MRLKITKGAKKFGYIIWNNKHASQIESMLGDRNAVDVVFNGFSLGQKNIDRKYHRISLGYKLTRALPENHNTFSVTMNNNILEVKSLHVKY